MEVSGLCGEGHQCPKLEGTWAGRSQNPGIWLSSPDDPPRPSHHPRESAALEREGGGLRAGPGHVGGQQQVGRKRACSPRTHICAGTGPLTNPSTKPGRCPLTVPLPANDCHFSSHFCHHQREGVGLILLPPPTPLCEPRLPGWC